jgi:hypothetical protein
MKFITKISLIVCLTGFLTSLIDADRSKSNFLDENLKVDHEFNLKEFIKTIKSRPKLQKKILSEGNYINAMFDLNISTNFI